MLEEDSEYRLRARPDSIDSQEDKDDCNKTYVSQSKLSYVANSSSEWILFRLNDVEEICRICLGAGSVPIFGTVDISDDVRHFANIELKADDCLPQHICSKCMEVLESAINFKRIAQKSDNVLRRTIKDDVSQESQSNVEMVKELTTLETSDAENSDVVYLEYAETVNESENEFGSELSNGEEKTDSFIETVSNAESIDYDSDKLQSLVDSLNKNARFPQCEICHIIFRTLEQLNEHSSHHDSEEIVRCEVCKNIIHKDFYNIHLRLHRESHNQRMGKAYRKKKVECTVCGKYISKNYLKKHLIVHEAETVRLKICTVCSKPITTNYMSDHMKRVHSQNKSIKPKEQREKQKCPICYRRVRESIYKDHVASHATSRKKYVCEVCGKEMFSDSSFKTHILIHKDEYKFKCQFCPYRGKHLGLLRIHVRTHTKDYAYQCLTCNSKFITKSNLNSHMKTHSAEAKFVCFECGRSFAVERSLRLHMTSVHKGIKAVSCDICGINFVCQTIMLAHKRRVHSIPARPVGRTPSYLLKANDK